MRNAGADSVDYDRVVAFLKSSEGATAAHAAAALVDTEPGLYSIFVDDARAMPEPFRSMLRARSTRLLYVGLAEDSLYARLVGQELGHKKAATFFRSLGAVLGYLPEAGSLRGKSNQNNYRFSRLDTETIVAWIQCHLSVKWTTLNPAYAIAWEKRIIKDLCPLINLQHHPSPCVELKAMRDNCRRIARG